MGLFSRKPPPPAPRSGEAAVGRYRRFLAPTPDVDALARDLLAEHRLTGLVDPNDVVDRIMRWCRAEAHQGLENTSCSGFLPEIDSLVARPGFRPNMLFDYLANHGVAMVAATHDLIVTMLASPGFRDAMADDLQSLATTAVAAELEGLSPSPEPTSAAGRVYRCDARSWVSGIGLSVCVSPASHGGDHDWVPADWVTADGD